MYLIFRLVNKKIQSMKETVDSRSIPYCRTLRNPEYMNVPSIGATAELCLVFSRGRQSPSMGFPVLLSAGFYDADSKAMSSALFQGRARCGNDECPRRKNFP